MPPTPIKLTDLDPSFIKIVPGSDGKKLRTDATFEDADGIMFGCPKCFRDNGNSMVGTHRVICWKPHVPKTVTPGPGRWDWQGTGLHDMTLVAGSSSILFRDGCKWHGFIRGGMAIG